MLLLPREEFEKRIAAIPEHAVNFLQKDDYGSELIFLEHEGSIFSISFRPEQKLIWVMGAFGHGLEGLRALKKFALHWGYQWVGFKTRRDNKAMQGIVKYCKAERMAETDSGDEYCITLTRR